MVFCPRPDNIELNDQQTAFFESRSQGVDFLFGGCGSGLSTVSIARMVDFLMRTPPPFKDTPFWVVGHHLPDVMFDVCNEFLMGKWMLSPDWIDFERITRDTVPLKMARLGGNWSIRFLGEHNQIHGGEMIGGFLVVNDIRFSMFQEILRATREYQFTGGKMVACTPCGDRDKTTDQITDLDSISSALRKMLGLQSCGIVDQEWLDCPRALPESWNVFHLNTG